MPSAVDRIYKQAMKLSEKARGELAARLLHSLDSKIKLHPEWDEEIRRRVEDVRTGRVRCHSLSEAMRIIMDDSDEPSQAKDTPTRHKGSKARPPLVHKS